MNSIRNKIHIARFLIAIVVFFNLECAFQFILRPGEYSAGFELAGVPGTVMVASLGILFVMWNVPYGFAMFSPVRHQVSLIEAIMMQAVGLVGESLLLAGLPIGYQALKATATRFILFDGFGLAALIAALFLVIKAK